MTSPIHNESPDERFGCATCWPEAADAAWEASRQLTETTELVDESHFRVTIRACPACAQQFVAIFTDTVDWASGDDPQYWTVLPVSASEADELRLRGADLSERKLDSLPAMRRSLRRDWPKGGVRRAYWSNGIIVGHHD